MLPEYKPQASRGINTGMTLEVVGLLLPAFANIPALSIFLFAVPFVVGLAFQTWGSFAYAQGKGYHPAVGLFGILSCVGLAVLALLPDRDEF